MKCNITFNHIKIAQCFTLHTVQPLMCHFSQYKGVVAPSRMMPTNEPSTSSREISHPKNEPSISSREIRQHTSPTKPLDEQRNNNVKQRRGQSRTDKLATDSVLRAVFNLSEDLQKFSFPVRPSGGQQTSGQANETVFVELESSTVFYCSINIV